MRFFSSIKSKVVSTFVGDLVADLGTLPIDEHGHEISLSIRRRPGKPAHLQIKFASDGETSYFQITRMSEWADQFERVAQEMRRQL
jgi:hypothetical protein